VAQQLDEKGPRDGIESTHDVELNWYCWIVGCMKILGELLHEHEIAVNGTTQGSFKLYCLSSRNTKTQEP
jgi:hypothetical protein